jgi:diadenosine tetraphosphate (Ap4A) HIT family hydrolase
MPDRHRKAASGDTGCVFCGGVDPTHVLRETEHFFLLADHAPAAEGHMLIIPRSHYACYGAMPAALDAELLRVKSQATTFLRTAYREPIFFKHGVYRQTVFHAHLHAIPLVSRFADVDELARMYGTAVQMQEDVRAWYARM